MTWKPLHTVLFGLVLIPAAAVLAFWAWLIGVFRCDDSCGGPGWSGSPDAWQWSFLTWTPAVFLLVFALYFGLIAAAPAAATVTAYVVQMAVAVLWLGVAATGDRFSVAPLVAPLFALEVLAVVPLFPELSRRLGAP